MASLLTHFFRPITNPVRGIVMRIGQLRPSFEMLRLYSSSSIQTYVNSMWPLCASRLRTSSVNSNVWSFAMNCMSFTGTIVYLIARSAPTYDTVSLQLLPLILTKNALGGFPDSCSTASSSVSHPQTTYI